MTKALPKIAFTLTAILLFSLLAFPVFAKSPQGAHLWFFSQDPDTLPWDNPKQLPNPQDVDPKYVGSHSDPWLNQGVIIASGEWDEFTIWLGLHKFESLNTKVVICINNAANEAINTITVNGIEIESWNSGKPSALAPHGVFKSTEFYGYAEVDVGDLYAPPLTPYKTAITINIDLNDEADLTNAKIHFDAYGSTKNGGIVFSPYSHDLTFVIPEPATIFMATSALLAFGLYAYKRKKQ
jgi:hypothetical protein